MPTLIREVAARIADLAIIGRHDQATRDRVAALLLEYALRLLEGYGASDGDRGAAHRYALANDYYWMPCPLCGRWEGGHEWSKQVLFTTEYGGFGICGAPECAAEAERLGWPSFTYPERRAES